MKTTKNAYLEKLTKQIQMKSVKVGKNLEGSTPPSVFIGRWSYPKVYAGPMMANQLGDTAIMDSPESWIGEHKNQEDNRERYAVIKHHDQRADNGSNGNNQLQQTSLEHIGDFIQVAGHTAQYLTGFVLVKKA